MRDFLEMLHIGALCLFMLAIFACVVTVIVGVPAAAIVWIIEAFQG